MNTWVNIRTLGAMGDGFDRRHCALQKAIARTPHNLFSLRPVSRDRHDQLKPDTVLIGLHPSVTRILLADSLRPFRASAVPSRCSKRQKDGTNIVTGIGLYTNGINPRAVAAKWMAGTDSMMNDVRFLGGHGTLIPTPRPAESPKVWEQIYNNTHTADSNHQSPLGWTVSQLVDHRGGGGTFVDIWTPSTFAQAGMYISNTSTSGRIYELSSEHHVRNEVVLQQRLATGRSTRCKRKKNGARAVSHCRWTSAIPAISPLRTCTCTVWSAAYQPFPYAISVTNSTDIRFRNVHCYSDSKVSFDNTLFDRTHNFEMRQREFCLADALRQRPAG